VRVAALYDVHGNLPALEAVVADVDREQVDLIVFGGDLVSGPFPRETLDLARSLGGRARLIRGNAERELASPAPAREGGPPAGLVEWVVAQLAPEDVEALAALPLTETLGVDGVGATLFCHATPRSDEEIVTRITPDEDVAAAFAGVAEQLVVCGHTHVQFDRRVGGLRIVNAGSVGLPNEGRPGAYWALLAGEVEHRRTEYDTERAAALIRATGLPGADELAREHVLTQPSADEASEYFERLARERREAAP
jgi:predicted phosphodiesterase